MINNKIPTQDSYPKDEDWKYSNSNALDELLRKFEEEENEVTMEIDKVTGKIKEITTPIDIHILRGVDAL